jgi:hypothetical protein
VISFDFLNFCGLSKNWRSGILGDVAKPVVKHKKILSPAKEKGLFLSVRSVLGAKKAP